MTSAEKRYSQTEKDALAVKKGKIKVQHETARSAKIHDHDLSQTADPHVQQILYKTTSQNREMDHGNAER